MPSYIETHKTESDLRALDQKVTLLLTKSQQQTSRTESLEKKIRALEARNEELETRLKASDHNALSRHLNARLPPHHPLHALHNPLTNTPPKTFPRKGTDIKTMPAAEVSALLKELDVDVKGVSAAPGERKARLREFVGLVERERERGGDEDDKKGGKVDGKAGKKKEEGRPLPGKATGPPPGKVLPIGARD